MGHAFPPQLTEPESVEPEGALGQRIVSRSDVETFATKLTATRIMLTLFSPNILENHVHVSAQLAPKSEPVLVLSLEHY